MYDIINSNMDTLFLLAAEAFDKSLLADIKFYVILALLAAALVTIIVIFAKLEQFKAKKNKGKETNYIPPEIIKVEDKKSR